MSSVNRLSKVFEQYHKALSEGFTDSPLLTLFITAGYPEKDSFKDLVLSLDTAGADILEIGMPFSDPLADGPVIQASSQHALDSGVDLDWIFSTIKEIRAFSEIPILLMGYFNPVLSYGLEAFCSSAAASGIDGIILPDLPAEEVERIRPYADKYGLKRIGFVTPTSTDERIRLMDQTTNGFIYTVLVTGVTGGSSGAQKSEDMHSFLSRVRQNTLRNPIMAGFGIQTANDIDSVKEYIDGYIVGSELIRTIDRTFPEPGWIEQVASFVKAFKTD